MFGTDVACARVSSTFTHVGGTAIYKYLHYVHCVTQCITEFIIISNHKPIQPFLQSVRLTKTRPFHESISLISLRKRSRSYVKDACA